MTKLLSLDEIFAETEKPQKWGVVFQSFANIMVRCGGCGEMQDVAFGHCYSVCCAEWPTKEDAEEGGKIHIINLNRHFRATIAIFVKAKRID